MKRYVRSSLMPKQSKKVYVQSVKATDYTNRYNKVVDGQKFSVYTKYEDSPENFQCQISEIHPYDDADYAWCKKDSPNSATVYKNGKKYGYIEVRDWDEYEESEPSPSDDKYIKEITDYICRQLRVINKDVKPVIVHN